MRRLVSCSNGSLFSAQVVNIQDDEYWERLWGGPTSTMASVVEQISVADVRKLKKTCPKNLATLCRRVQPPPPPCFPPCTSSRANSVFCVHRFIITGCVQLTTAS